MGKRNSLSSLNRQISSVYDRNMNIQVPQTITATRGFTLVELMAVILIISLMVGATVAGWPSGGDSEARAGAARADSAFLLARSVAVTRGGDAYVLVCTEDGDPELNWDYRMIVVMAESSDGTSTNQVGSPVTLPTGIYYDSNGSSPWLSGVEVGTRFKIAMDTRVGVKWDVYKYNARGLMQNLGDAGFLFTNPVTVGNEAPFTFVVREGIVDHTQARPSAPTPLPGDVGGAAGFKIFQNGTPMHYSSVN